MLNKDKTEYHLTLDDGLLDDLDEWSLKIDIKLDGRLDLLHCRHLGYL